MSNPNLKSGKKPAGDFVEFYFSTKILHAAESGKFKPLSTAVREMHSVSQKIVGNKKALIERAKKAAVDNAAAIENKVATKAVKAKYNPQIAKAAEELKAAVDNAAAAKPVDAGLSFTVKGSKVEINITSIKNNLKQKQFNKKVRKALVVEGVFADVDDAKAYVASRKSDFQQALESIIDLSFGKLNNVVEAAERKLNQLKESKAARIEAVTGKAASRNALRQVRRANKLVQKLISPNSRANKLLLKKGKRYTSNLTRNAKIAIASVIDAFSESARECVKRKFYRSNAVIKAVQNLVHITAEFKNFTSAVDQIAVARHYADLSGFVSYLTING